MKRYGVSAEGEVVEISRFSTSATAVEALNKADALKQLLKGLYAMVERPPVLRFRGDGWQLVSATLEGKFSSTTGRISGCKESFATSLCQTTRPTQSEALADTTFDYYAKGEGA